MLGASLVYIGENKQRVYKTCVDIMWTVDRLLDRICQCLPHMGWRAHVIRHFLMSAAGVPRSDSPSASLPSDHTHHGGGHMSLPESPLHFCPGGSGVEDWGGVEFRLVGLASGALDP